YRTVYAYSYHWEQNKVKEIKLDSLIVERNKDGELSIVKRIVNHPYCTFFYKNNQIDSISYIDYYHGEPIHNSIAYRYDIKRNIDQINTFSFQDNAWRLSPALILMQTFYDEYDDKKSPYQILFKELGT